MAEDLAGDTPAAWVVVGDLMAVGWEEAALVAPAWEAVASVVQVEGLAPVVTAGGCLEEWGLEVSLGSAALVAWARAGSVVLADRVAVAWVVGLLEGAICRAVDWAPLAYQTPSADEVQVSREVPAALLVERLRQVA